MRVQIQKTQWNELCDFFHVVVAKVLDGDILVGEF